MQSVILAGGLGTRLRPLTNRIPKVLLKVCGKEFLFWLIDWQASQGIDDIVVCAGYLYEAIARSLNSLAIPGVTIRLSVEEQPLGTAGAVRNAAPLLDEEFFLVNGDTYLPVSYETISRRWKEIRGRVDCLLVAYDNRERIAPNDTLIDDERVVVDFSKSRSGAMQYVNAGLAMVKKSAFAPLPPGVPVSLEEDVFPDLISRRTVEAFITPQRYYDIGTPERLKTFEEYLDNKCDEHSG